MPTEKVASLLTLNRLLSYEVNPSMFEDEFWNRPGTQELTNAPACEGSSLKLYPRYQLTLNSLLNVELKECT